MEPNGAAVPSNAKSQRNRELMSRYKTYLTKIQEAREILGTGRTRIKLRRFAKRLTRADLFISSANAVSKVTVGFVDVILQSYLAYVNRVGATMNVDLLT